MNCLACGEQNAYGVANCGRCGERFESFPPYLKANHVSQLQWALSEHLEGRLGAEELAERFHAFNDLLGRFEETWRVLEGRSLHSRLSTALAARFGEAVAELDHGLNLLLEALGAVEAGLEGPDPHLLRQAHSLLSDAFRVSCGACALLIKHLEEDTSQGLGTVLDVQGL